MGVACIAPYARPRFETLQLRLDQASSLVVVLLPIWRVRLRATPGIGGVLGMLIASMYDRIESEAYVNEMVTFEGCTARAEV